MRRVVTIDYDTDSARWAAARQVVEIELGQTVAAGREAELSVGLNPPDPGVSRRALTISLRHDGWVVKVSNANHVWMYPWGQRPAWLEAGTTVAKRWPRIGLLVMGMSRGTHHWVLLESDDVVGEVNTASGKGPIPLKVGITALNASGPGLTQAQLDAIQTVFGKHLQWPPVAAPEPLLLDAAARRLGGIASNAVRLRLEAAGKRSEALGPDRQVSVTQPDYVFLLATAGYLPLPQMIETGAAQ